MRRFFAVAILIVLGVLLYFYTGNRMSSIKEKLPLDEYQKVMAYNLEESYPESVNDVIVLNNKIVKLMYNIENTKGFDIDTHLPELIKQQRRLFDDSLIEFNPFEVQLEKVKTEIENNNKLSGEKKFALIGSKMLTPEVVEKKDFEYEVRKVKVIFYTSSSNDIYMEYGLVNKNGKWLIIGYKQTGPFTIMED